MGMGKLRTKLGYKERNAGYLQALIDAHHEEWYRKFVYHPSINSFIKRVKGWDNGAVLLDRTILRPNIPGGESTHVHYDQIFLRVRYPPFLKNRILD